MTENEAQKWLERFEWDDSEETSEALATICEALQEYSRFKAIGTVEEFKTLKEKNVAKKIIQTVENGKMKRIFSCCDTDCTQMTSWMIPKFCPHCGSKIET